MVSQASSVKAVACESRLHSKPDGYGPVYSLSTLALFEITYSFLEAVKIDHNSM